MCEAVTAGVIIGVVSAGAQAAQAAHEEEKQKEWQQQQEERARQHALAQARLAAAQIQTQHAADTAQAAIEVEQNTRSAEAAKASATVTAGEVGAFGRNFEALLGEFSLQQAEFQTAVEMNLGTRNAFAQIGLQQAELNRDAAIMNAMRPPIPKPKYANFAIQGLGTGLSVYNLWDRAASVPATVPKGTKIK